MIRTCIVDTRDSIVHNVVEYEAIPGNPPPGFDEHFVAVPHDAAEQGWRWNGGTSFTDLDPPPPPVDRVPEEISDRQFFQALAMQGAVTQAEALAAVKTGEIPASLQAFVDQMPEKLKFSAEMVISGATVFHRSNPMTAALAEGMGWTPEQVDALWLAASKL